MTRRRSTTKTRTKRKKQKHDYSHKYHLPQKPKTPTSISMDESQIKKEKMSEEGGTTKFFGCYLLTSLSPRFKGHSYIGFTVNPKRRIRQHNGEITNGAFRTKKKRPWEMVLCIHGFPSNVAALQFEWAWQHPRESIAVREAAANFKTLGGLANKIKLALTMLTIHTWQSMNVTVSFFSMKYMKHAAGCPSLPHQMKIHFCPMDELPCYGSSDHLIDHDDEHEFDSNDSEVSTNSSDDKLESLADVSMEMNPSSIHVQSSAMQKSAIGRALESELCSIVGSQEEHMQPLHQFPVDVSGFTLNTFSEEFRPWSFLASENEVFPTIEEKQPSYHLLADVSASTGNDLNDPLRLGKGSGAEDLRDNIFAMVDQIQPVQPAGSSEREHSSKVDYVSVVENTVKKDIMACIVIDDITEEESLPPTRAQSRIRFSSADQPFSNQGIEVIELCTPSPDFRFTTCSKKKRVITDFPDIIDLTRSPSFVQL